MVCRFRRLHRKQGVSRQTLHPPTHIADGRYGPPVISYDVTVVVAVAASVAEINSVALPVRWTVKPLIVPVNGSAFDSPDGSTRGGKSLGGWWGGFGTGGAELDGHVRGGVSLPVLGGWAIA